MKKEHVPLLMGCLGLFFGVLPAIPLLVFSVSQEQCWSETPLSSGTWGIVLAVDWLIAFAVVLPIFIFHMSTQLYRSGHSVNWYWLNALTLLFDIGWLAAGSYQIAHWGLSKDCRVVIAGIVLLCVKVIWTLLYSCALVIGG